MGGGKGAAMGGKIGGGVTRGGARSSMVVGPDRSGARWGRPGDKARWEWRKDGEQRGSGKMGAGARWGWGGARQKWGPDG